jgi:hypothetical protein
VPRPHSGRDDVWIGDRGCGVGYGGQVTGYKGGSSTAPGMTCGSGIGDGFWVIGDGLQGTGLWVIGDGLWVTGYRDSPASTNGDTGVGSTWALAGVWILHFRVTVERAFSKRNAVCTVSSMDSSSAADRGFDNVPADAEHSPSIAADDGNGVVNMKFTVKDAGEVEIERDGDRLILIDARPNEGWEVEIEDDEEEDEEEDDEGTDEDEGDGSEIEVTFTQGDREVEFEAEIDDGRLAIEIEETWYGADPGTYTVGEAGEVEFQRDGDRLVVVGVIANDGWEFEAGHEDDEEDASNAIEIAFTSGDREAEFEATIEDGVLEVEIETKEYVDEGQS